MSKSILGICGSLREGSYNRAVLRAAIELAPDGMSIEESPSIGDLPLYNADLDDQEKLGGPPAVAAFKKAIDAADALLFVTPEYNYSVPGVLKNAIDWASRPGFKSVLAHKPVFAMGASMGGTGTVRAQGHLRQVFYGVLAEVFPHGEVLVTRAQDKVEDGVLTDEGTREFLAKALSAYAEWLERF